MTQFANSFDINVDNHHTFIECFHLLGTKRVPCGSIVIPNGDAKLLADAIITTQAHHESKQSPKQ
jgi:hypothetical protein